MLEILWGSILRASCLGVYASKFQPKIFPSEKAVNKYWPLKVKWQSQYVLVEHFRTLIEFSVDYYQIMQTSWEAVQNIPLWGQYAAQRTWLRCPVTFFFNFYAKLNGFYF